MDTVLTALHVVAAVFVIGPMAILPMTAMRAVRAGSGPVVEVLARATRVFTLASLLVALLGFAVLGSVAKTDKVSVTTGWVLTSILLYLIALGLSLFVVVPALQSASAALATGGADAGRAVYGRIAASSGIVALLLIAVTVLMVWRP
jgi:uncharacterized membrane protein